MPSPWSSASAPTFLCGKVVDQDRYRELIPDAHLTRWQGVGHSPHIEDPDRFRELLDAFLRQKDPG